MAALVGRVEVGCLLGGPPYVAVEVPLSPHLLAGRREQQFTVRAVQVDLGFRQPGERRGGPGRHNRRPLPVVGLGALEDLPTRAPVGPRLMDASAKQVASIVGPPIRRTRRRLDMSQEALAEIHRTQMTGIEWGERLSRIDTLIKLANWRSSSKS